MKNIELEILHINEIENNYDLIIKNISKERKNKSKRYIKKNDELLSIGAGYFLFKYFKEKQIKISKNGKPYIEGGPCFNISHSNEYVIFAKSFDSEIGVDIEYISKENEDAIRYVLNESEKNNIKEEELFQMWTSKESLLKCDSKNILDIKNIPGLPLNGIKIYNGNKYYTNTFKYENYSISVTLKDSNPFNIKINKIIITD